jgi:hypothetical protein
MSIGQVSKNKKAMNAMEKKEGFLASAKNWFMKKAPELYNNFLKPGLKTVISGVFALPPGVVDKGFNLVEDVAKTGYNIIQNIRQNKNKNKQTFPPKRKSRTIVEELPDDYDEDTQIQRVGGGGTDRSDYDILEYKK